MPRVVRLRKLGMSVAVKAMAAAAAAAAASAAAAEAAGEVAVEAAGAAAVAELVMGAEMDHQGMKAGRIWRCPRKNAGRSEVV